MRVIGVIPARMGSSRFPGKPLAVLHGRPMVEHVHRNAAACPALDTVLIATCDREIADAAHAFGARVAMTSPDHERASDRVAEAAAGDGADIVVMIQGDEPMVTPAMIEAAVAPLRRDPAIGCTNLVAPIRTPEAFADPNTIKVVTAPDGRILYFSRAAIPCPRPGFAAPAPPLKQVCVIPFRRQALATFCTLPAGRLETAESIDMLRFLEHGFDVHAVPTDVDTQAVDTAEDLAVVATRLHPEARRA